MLDTSKKKIDFPITENELSIFPFVSETYTSNTNRIYPNRFPVQVDSGLIEVLAPSPTYYPNFDKLRITLGDSPERVRWRSKQNLDFAFLMSYSQPKGYILQMKKRTIYLEVYFQEPFICN